MVPHFGAPTELETNSRVEAHVPKYVERIRAVWEESGSLSRRVNL
jgi:hypothetical protein